MSGRRDKKNSNASTMPLQQTIQYNCDISDARDNGIYSICVLVLRLRNLYKWEKGIAPWIEPDPPVLLDWIAAKEEYWLDILGQDFQDLSIGDQVADPFNLLPVNNFLEDRSLVYGAGYGRSMKAIFFLAEKIEEKTVDGCPAVILGREMARDLASPFALLQEGIIYLRKEPFRYFLWDQIHDIRPTGKDAMQSALSHYGLLKQSGNLDRAMLIERLDHVVEEEMTPFLYHELGEMHEDFLDSNTMKKIAGAFPDSAVEFLVRAVKDVLADTNEKGMLGHIIAAEKIASQGFYMSFLDGLRRLLSPEIVKAYGEFLAGGDWQVLEEARTACRKGNMARAEKLLVVAERLNRETPEQIAPWIEQELLAPLGLELPQSLR